MKYHSIVAGSLLGLLILASCDSNPSDENSCNVLGVAVDCEQSSIYNKLLAINEEINQTFEEGAEPLSLEADLSLREEFVAYYRKHEKVIQSVYASIKDSIGASFPPEQLLEMRLREVEHFKNEIISREKTAAFLKTLNIDTYEKDTLLSEYGSTGRYLIMRITNTSDQTITSIAVEKNYKQGKDIHRASLPTHYIFTPEQIHPTPEIAELIPGSTLTLAFETSDNKKAMPKIVDITVKQDE